MGRARNLIITSQMRIQPSLWNLHTGASLQYAVQKLKLKDHGEKDHRNYYMINLHKSYMAELRLTPGSAVRCTCITHHHIDPGLLSHIKTMKEWSKNALCNEASYSQELNPPSSKI